jgi:uncharacterized membrane protein YeaQ/YmgE (transglycosylase-associated protein family)
LLGLVAGAIGRLLVPDMWSGLSGPKSWLFSLVLGLAGAVVGYLIFTDWLGIGDTDVFDWGGVLGAIIGVVIFGDSFGDREGTRDAAAPCGSGLWLGLAGPRQAHDDADERQQESAGIAHKLPSHELGS